jgi:hypothetical protein
MGYSIMGMAAGWLPLSGLGLVGVAFAGRTERGKRTAKQRKRSATMGGVALIVLSTLLWMGCGGYGSNTMTAGAQNVTLMVNGTSAGITHSTAVTLTIK